MEFGIGFVVGFLFSVFCIVVCKAAGRETDLDDDF